jgi:hypothetical protein
MTLRDLQTKILTTRAKVPLPSASTVIAAPEIPKHCRQTSANYELSHYLQRNRLEAASSQLVSSPLDQDGAFALAKAASSRETVQSQTIPTVTSLSNIGMSLETDETGLHLLFLCF